MELLYCTHVQHAGQYIGRVIRFLQFSLSCCSVNALHMEKKKHGSKSN
jgi:hypothetical protein